MSETYRKVGNLLEITKTNGSVIFTMTREEIVDKIAEAQTKIDHFNLNIAEAENEKAKWDDMLKEIDK